MPKQQAKKGRLAATGVSLVGAIAIVATVVSNLTTIADDIPKLWRAMVGSAPTADAQT